MNHINDQAVTPLPGCRPGHHLARQSALRVAYGPGLGHAAAAVAVRVANYLAMIFIAGYARYSGASSTFYALSKGSTTSCRRC